ncbi:hypothetical protein EIP91_004952 [Steccherinum ochraceum]|uniref:DNA (cytosine-5-)-methyltransferase n=1 Tax=Steccherinum ochraceum TaxID=92696 RepID=A0A4R0RG80_9APHY|nr:hypothetical protein EIP91_004952 [Steccherinum ochraceum]
MAKRNRPSAFEVSFPQEQVAQNSTSLVERERARLLPQSRAGTSAAGSRESSVTLRTPASTSRGSSRSDATPGSSSSSSISYTRIGSTPTAAGNEQRLKRKSVVELEEGSDEDVGSSSEKRMRMSKTAHQSGPPRYKPQDRDLKETATISIIGEDPEDVKPDDALDAQERKPIRYLSDFAFFDTRRNLEMAPLTVLDGVASAAGHYEAVGYVAPMFVNEEDAGQEDEDEEDVMQRLRTSQVLNYSLNFTVSDDPLYIETRFAWYILRRPSAAYREVFNQFYHPRRVAQIIVSAALDPPNRTLEGFHKAFLGVYDEFLGARLDKQAIDSAIPILKLVIPSLAERPILTASPMIKELLGPSFPRDSSLVPLRPPNAKFFHPRVLTGNLDLAVLRPDKQNQTHVTPLIDRLAEGLFREHLIVVGPPPRPPNLADLERAARARRLKLIRYITRDRQTTRKITFPAKEQLKGIYWKSVEVEGEDEAYKLGDCVVVRAGEYEKHAAPVIPPEVDVNELLKTTAAADYFWFGIIVWINQQNKTIHIRWFEHASKSILQEICNPRELFLSKTCSTIDVTLLCGKAEVRYGRPPPLLDVTGKEPYDYFCSLQYSDIDGSFTAAPPKNEFIMQTDPPDNCPVCDALTQQEHEGFPQAIKNGFAWRSHQFHVLDYVLIGTPENVCEIGQITEIVWSNSARAGAEDRVKVRALGRVGDIVGVPGCPEDVIKDERHLFLTDSILLAPITQIIRPCVVAHSNTFDATELQSFLSLSPYHFYAKYKFPDTEVTSWAERSLLTPKDVLICKVCFAEDIKREENLKDFAAAHSRKPLRAFDPFGGVGAFALGLEDGAGGFVKTTHAVEISPSAAETLKKNSPHIVVYNQCSNVILRYAVKKQAGHQVEVPVHLGNKSAVSDPPQPGDIDCIVAGFPCQPHSRLNMFQRADDKKSHLILNLCAWVDFLKPKFCFFENVRGFLSYNLNARQAGRYRVEGGIEMGGLKWLIYAMLEMGYQVRYGLLQAAHYGTPQSRVRFFLVAAKHPYPLPSFPVPVYEFPEKDSLEIRLGSLPRPLAPINAATKAAHRLVTVEDAIGDLPRFDWRSPKRPTQPSRTIPHPTNPSTQLTVPSLPCNKARAFCGYHGSSAVYHHPPRTAFQQRCRESGQLKDLQHYTRVLKEQVVERVVNIPMRPKADYRTLKQSDWEWQFSNPSSAVARDGFRPGMYGRLDKDGWFHTTVTNVEPTAKQSWVLNPFCKRVVTVRELARSQGFPDHFVFVSKNDDVKTMQRQIGNAVPWPVAQALGRELRDAMVKKWTEDQENAISIDD